MFQKYSIAQTIEMKMYETYVHKTFCAVIKAVNYSHDPPCKILMKLAF